MVVNDNITKRAITYSVLAHISGSAKLAKGQLDVFIPIVKKCLHHISDGKAEIKGANISEIADQILLDWQIEIPTQNVYLPTQTIFVLCKSLCINGEIFE